MKVSFISPLYNCLPLTQAMLASLRATLPAGIEYEVIFVDDGSTDGTREWLRTLPAPCRAILNEKNLGFAGACNRGAAAATGELLFFLNNDLILLPGWLEPMLAAIEAPAVGLVGNIQLNFATGAIDHTGIFFNHQGKPEHCTNRPGFGFKDYQTVDAVTGACFAIRRDVWTKLNGFDEGFRNGCEDVDLCLRARAIGLSCVVALQSIVRHHISQSAGRKLRDEQNTARLVERWSDTIAELSAPAWSRRCVSNHAELSRVFDYPVVWSALMHSIFRGSPPALVREGVTASLAVERARWREMFGGAPAPRPPAGPGPI